MLKSEAGQQSRERGLAGNQPVLSHKGFSPKQLAVAEIPLLPP